jgi:signal peptide peptidase SppA
MWLSSSLALRTRRRTSPEARLGVEDDHEDDAVAHELDVDVRLLALVELSGELVLFEQLRHAARRGDVAGRERGERRRVEVVDVAAAAMSCPFLSTMKTTLAFASLTRRSTTAWIWLNSSSYITICGFRVLVGRHATLVAPGLASVRTYGRSLLAKLGVSLEVHRRAEFKTAVEGLVEESMSEPQREQAKAIVDGLEAELVHALAERPNLDEDGVRAIFARAMITAEEAVSLGLADAVVHDDELRSALVDEGKPAPTLVRAPVYLALVKAKLFRPFVLPRVIAVVPILGAIGEAGPPGSASREQLVPTLRRLARERRVAAVVLYVDSPGGSALASERIHREVELLATKKPVVACFGDVAASGGYYVAAPAHVIVARAQTITGSIGVISARLVLSRLFDTIGLRTEVIKNAPSADFLANPRQTTDEERAIAERSIQAFYDRFLEIVGRGRRMTRDAVDAVARGRVWTGSDARKHGLVDVIGGFREALAEARTRAGDASLEPAAVWPAGGEEAPIEARTEHVRAAAVAVAEAIDPEVAALARLALEPSEHALAYAVDLPRIG